jgi:hypothetical protein
MKRYRNAISLFVLLLLAAPLQAYVEPVHEEVTQRCFDRLTIDFQARFGVPRTHVVQNKSLVTWLRDGARHEDASFLSAEFSFNQRPLNHFLNPLRGTGLTPLEGTGCFEIGEPADRWAGVDQSLLTSNEFTVSRAKRAYVSAIVGASGRTRDESLSDLFFTLGHVIHLVQDMAQPEHTRNDQHAFSLQGAPQASLYEAWGDEYLYTKNNIPPVVSYDGYPNVDLDKYASYFRTPDGKGLADFSSRNYLTQDTNYDDRGLVAAQCYIYPLPREEDTTRHFRHVQGRALEEDGKCCRIVPYDEYVLISQVTDSLTGASDVDEAHSFWSALNLETLKYRPNEAYVYSLGEDSWYSRARVLVPRAVGYSAGLVSRFFRGKLDATWKRTNSGAGPASYEVTLTNRSAETIGTDATVTAVFKATPGYFEKGGDEDTGVIFQRARISELAPGFTGLGPGASVKLTVPPIAGLKDTDQVTAFERRIVVEGPLGAEKDAVISLVQPAGKTVRAEIRWTCARGGNIGVYDNVGGVQIHSQYPSAAYCGTDYMKMPEACVDSYPGNEAQPLVITLSPTTPGRFYTFGSFQHFPNYCQFTTTFYVDGQFERTEYSTMSAGDFEHETFATWQP